MSCSTTRAPTLERTRLNSLHAELSMPTRNREHNARGLKVRADTQGSHHSTDTCVRVLQLRAGVPLLSESLVGDI
jgi:hypothetical protein